MRLTRPGDPEPFVARYTNCYRGYVDSVHAEQFMMTDPILKNLNGNEKFILMNYNLLPKLKISYERKYFIYKDKVRVTYDCPPEYELMNNNSTKITDNNFVIEIKFSEDNYSEAMKLIKNNYFSAQRYSKYLKGLSLMGKVQYF